LAEDGDRSEGRLQSSRVDQRRSLERDEVLRIALVGARHDEDSGSLKSTVRRAATVRRNNSQSHSIPHTLACGAVCLDVAELTGHPQAAAGGTVMRA
jgi:hypothetical protein